MLDRGNPQVFVRREFEAIPIEPHAMPAAPTQQPLMRYVRGLVALGIVAYVTEGTRP
jgi:hypothetical protein